MITRNSDPVHRSQRSWQIDLANAYKDPVTLLQDLDLDPTRYGDGQAARRQFPMLVPRAFAAKIRQGDPNDPLLRQVLPIGAEMRDTPGFDTDPTEEQQGSTPGLLHKYRSRALLMLRSGCAVNCRYCFRRHFPYQQHKVDAAQIRATFDYLNSDPNINELLLSGGDPLMARDDHLAELFEQLKAVPQLKRIRIHTRLPVVMPSRITDELVQLLADSPWQIVMVLHSNHGNEIDDVFAAAMRRLKQANVTLLSQSVLLKGVNDDAQVLAHLSERLFAAGILPYYLHQLDKVRGAAHFEVSDHRARQIMAQWLELSPGFLVPRLVREIGGKRSKTPIDLKLA
ncbi:EF-P beta-lysylation protein EpmB [Ferrimonas pelagia]|uniref:L-lysine 2,3-aminomutase n=1 Tax=Ferrimonas pelagia TaxID=1177826 RepID=A0ABP9EG05_9GAMM